MEGRIKKVIEYLNKEKENCKEELFDSDEEIESNFIKDKINRLNEDIAKLKRAIDFK